MLESLCSSHKRTQDPSCELLKRSSIKHEYLQVGLQSRTAPMSVSVQQHSQTPYMLSLLL